MNPLNSTAPAKSPITPSPKSSASGKTRPVTTPSKANGTETSPKNGGATASALPGSRQEIVFRLDSTPAQEVLLAGNFTDWTKAPIHMRKDGNGTWQTKVLLAPGQYHYKFLVDGEWQDDPRATGHCPNPYGTSDNVLNVA